MFVKAHRQVRPPKKISYCLLSRIDHDASLSDMLSLPLFTGPADNIDALLSQYNGGLSTLLETHASLLTKSISERPTNPWLTDDVLAAHREARSLEHWWRHRKKCGTDLVVDRQIMFAAYKKKHKLLDREKAAYLNKEIAESTGKKSHFNIVDSLLIKKPGLKLPRHDSPRDLANQIGVYFSKKVSGIRTDLLASRRSHPTDDVPMLQTKIKFCNKKFEFESSRIE